MLKKIGIILVVIISIIGVVKLLLNFYIDYSYKKEITTELQEKYGEEFVVKKIKINKYNRKIIETIVSPKNNLEILFNRENSMVDNYINQVWNYSLEKEIQKKIGKKYINNIVSADVDIKYREVILNGINKELEYKKFQNAIKYDELPMEKQKNILEVNNCLKKYNTKLEIENNLNLSNIKKLPRDYQSYMKINICIFILKKMTVEDKKELFKIREIILSKQAESFLVTVIFINEKKLEYRDLKKKLKKPNDIPEIACSGNRNRDNMYRFFNHIENYKYIDNIVYIDNEGIRYNQKESNVSDVNEEFWKKEENK